MFLPRMTRRIPAWACARYDEHGEESICANCLSMYENQGSTTTRSDLPPRVSFGAGWFHVGATHWFANSDDKVFPSRDGTRLLAAAVCGAICDVTVAWAPQIGRECRKCQMAMAKMGKRPNRAPVH